MKGLESYKLDKAFTDGVNIILDAAPKVTFKVKLPSPYNRAYTQAIYSVMDFSMGDNGEVKAGGKLLETRYAQEDAFVKFCMVDVDGDQIPSDFAALYPDALSELMEKANELSEALTSKVSDTVGKSSTFSGGKENGQAKSDSMPSLKAGAV